MLEAGYAPGPPCGTSMCRLPMTQARMAEFGQLLDHGWSAQDKRELLPRTCFRCGNATGQGMDTPSRRQVKPKLHIGGKPLASACRVATNHCFPTTTPPDLAPSPQQIRQSPTTWTNSHTSGAATTLATHGPPECQRQKHTRAQGAIIPHTHTQLARGNETLVVPFRTRHTAEWRPYQAPCVTRRFRCRERTTPQLSKANLLRLREGFKRGSVVNINVDQPSNRVATQRTVTGVDSKRQLQ